MDLCKISKNNFKYTYKGSMNVHRGYDSTPYLAIQINGEFITINISENEFKILTNELGE